MDDEAGGDSKLLAVPEDRILPIYTHWQKPEDMNPLRLKAIQHFFEHYKDLEAGKWVKVHGWEGPDSAKQEILEGVRRYNQKNPQWSALEAQDQGGSVERSAQPLTFNSPVSNRGTISNATMLMILIKGLIAGPAVSL
jgi:hypothetical protein